MRVQGRFLKKIRKEVVKPIKVKKSKVGSSRFEEGQPGGEKREVSGASIMRKVKVEKDLFPFDKVLLDFLDVSIKAFKWKKFFKRASKIRLEVFKKFHGAKP